MWYFTSPEPAHRRFRRRALEFGEQAVKGLVKIFVRHVQSAAVGHAEHEPL